MSVADRKPFPVVQTDFDERDGQFSPDGHWIGLIERDRLVRDLGPTLPRAGTRVRISGSGGTQVRWRHDGKELFYIAMNGRLMAVPIEFGPQSRTLDAGSGAAIRHSHRWRVAG